ncbi:hypothetical protein [Nocardia wallacei]|uniref:hypothetical protein n=1 Tax=Nocardia wallacei TaxID=480035 RepID=UPI0024578FD9|nr:hypothetical protein [Nocardia wallacei]
MTEPDRILNLTHTAVTALLTGGQAALDNVIRHLDDDELEALITRLADNFGTKARFHTAPRRTGNNLETRPRTQQNEEAACPD